MEVGSSGSFEVPGRRHGRPVGAVIDHLTSLAFLNLLGQPGLPNFPRIPLTTQPILSILFKSSGPICDPAL